MPLWQGLWQPGSAAWEPSAIRKGAISDAGAVPYALLPSVGQAALEGFFDDPEQALSETDRILPLRWKVFEMDALQEIVPESRGAYFV